jgi:hypothetical protein
LSLAQCARRVDERIDRSDRRQRAGQHREERESLEFLLRHASGVEHARLGHARHAKDRASIGVHAMVDAVAAMGQVDLAERIA